MPASDAGGEESKRQDEFAEDSGIFAEPLPRPPPTYATVQPRVLRWRRTRNFIIISCTISGLIVIGEIAERTGERRQVSTFSSSSGFISEVRERSGSHVFSRVTALQREKKRPLKGQGERRGLSRRNIVFY